jgi:hypothetical protein
VKTGMDRIGRDITPERARRSCLDKVRYDSRNEARDRAVFLLKKYQNSRPMKPYRCALCSGFHLASIKTKGKDPGKTRDMRKAA